ncbi:RNA-binding transcriptional accessory protein [Psychromonas sp. MB-3u-54]|uniref:Tex family protein n=1 Tax=Psychromonas sp. MB-3u-54 TaxID=2058319 RepID=UPI000C320A99|nr:Tex family protein [Psychromonas sp. MB-3u-54]PKH04439.1 RNA-binding transcriptional accessory protein [Psychromonas sp. MB-3u-54]
MKTTIPSVNQKLANEVNLPLVQVNAFITLYDDGNTVPFIARYRKEATQGLDDIQLRLLETRLIYLRELNVRRQSILKAIVALGKLTPELKVKIEQCENKSTLEDLYLPYKSKRISKGELAIEAGLEPLADKLWIQADGEPQSLGRQYINPNKGFSDIDSVLEGALSICMERIVNDPQLLGKLRHYLSANAAFECKVAKGKEQQAVKYKDYFDYQEPLHKIPAHRFLAILRGKKEGLLKLDLNADPKQDKKTKSSYCESLIAHHLGFSWLQLPANNWRKKVIQKAWKGKLAGQLETQLITRLKDDAHENAMDNFASNLKALLMAAPAGPKVTLGLDPGLRTGCKLAVIDSTGKLLAHQTIYPHQPVNKTQQAAQEVLKLINDFKVELIAVGNGTASRESDDFIHTTLAQQNLEVATVIVSEAGASVYSASELASEEFPDLDVSIRGAVSIARRLQDPLAELVKIDAKAIGVGLYQHDVNQSSLSQRLGSVVEDCVNSVGVDLNSASVSLLARVAGLNHTVAKNIVSYRDLNGAFKSRLALQKVPRLGDKAYQQSAGFLRINNALNPLDNSAVHPEAYNLVKRIAAQQGVKVQQLLNNSGLLNSLDAQNYADQTFGVISIREIIQELAKPQRDPRPDFQRVDFAKNINKISDLQDGMLLQGVISNVTNFGAFVDIGVHQDGLVHISQLADNFVSDPFAIVKVGQLVNVRVVEIDVQRKRIALSMRLAVKA